MKFILALIVFISQPFFDVDISFVRSEFKLAVEDEDKAKDLIEYLDNFKKSPVLLGYAGSATILLAKHSFNPIKQYNYFLEGREMLEEAIGVDASCCELRYLRFSIQSNTPGFLNYKKNIEADKIFLINSLRNKISLDKEMRTDIAAALCSSTHCSESEKKLVKETLKWNM